MELTSTEVQTFIGLNQSNIEMEAAQNAVAPKCHFRPMILEHGDGENYVNTWWECSVCGHKKSNF